MLFTRKSGLFESLIKYIVVIKNDCLTLGLYLKTLPDDNVLFRNKKITIIAVSNIIKKILLVTFFIWFYLPVNAQPNNPNTGWFKNAKYGLFVHFLPSGSGFQKIVNEFNVTAFAQDCYDAGAGYVMFTLGQNSGYYCSPNATYDKYTEHKPGEKCAIRDLPMELSKALGKKGIKLMLYIPGGLPANDSVVAHKLGGVDFVKNENGDNWVYNPLSTSRWSEVMQEWSDRYGNKIAGWWVDGCYAKSSFSDADSTILSKALKHGNAKNIIAFNSGLNYDKVSNSQDYLAGEERNLLGAYCDERWKDGAQWHELSFLGKDWGSGEPSCNANELVDYLNNKINKNGGVLTIDVRMQQDFKGHIYPSHLAILKNVKKAMLNKNK